MNKTVKWLLAASRFAIGVMLIFTSGNVLAYGNKTVKAYVAQENLFAHYDGIANAGYSEENGDIHNASATTWKNVVSAGADANEDASKTGTIAVKDRYMSFETAGATAYYTADLAQLKTAFNNKALTVQLFFRALSYKQYAGFLSFWQNKSYRYLLFDQRQDNNYVSNGAFGGLQYASSAWTDVNKCCPKVYTKDYINKDVLITITVDGKGAHLIIDDGDVVHTNPGSNVAAALSKVKLGAGGNATCAKMYLYAVRFYNKVLSREEIATNLAIDRERFLGIGLKTTVDCSAADSETELSFDGETWHSSIVADNVENASIVTIKAKNSGFEEAHFIWTGLPSGATFLDEYKSQVQFKNPLEDLKITCKAARFDLAVSTSDENTEFSSDGENWGSSIQLPNVFATSNVTIKVRNSEFEGARFDWTGLPSGATFLDENRSQVQFKTPMEDLEITCKAERLNLAVSSSDENTELSFDGENWGPSIQLPNVFATSNVTVYARNVSGGDHAYFTWGNLPAGAVVNGVDNSSVAFQIPVVEESYSITCSSIASDELNIWTGGSGNFEDAAKWSLGVVPEANSIVILPNKTSAYTVAVNSPLDIGELIVGGGEGSGYPTVNFKTTSSKNYTKPTVNVVSGDVVVKANATITHNRNEQSSSFYKVAIKCRNLTVEKNAKISADEKGSYNLDPANNPSSTPGHVGNNSYGGTGGLVDKNHNLSDKLCWGSIREPYEIGSAGTDANIGKATFLAGGAVYLEVEDDAVINGTVSAVSRKGEDYYNGSGGSIYIKAGNLSGAGVIDASAGKVNKSSSGGGGRISVRLNKAISFEGFTGTIKAYASIAGTSTMVGCGTIYLEHAGDVADQGQLTVDNGTTGKPYNQYAAVLLNSYVRDRATPFGEVIVKNGANLRLPSGCVLKITKKLKTTGANLYALEGSKVEFVGEEDAVIEGKNSFYSFSCTVPGKKLIFGAGPDNRTTIKENGYFSIIGTEEKPIEIRSSEDGVQCEFALQAGVNQIDANQVNNKNVNLKDVNATFGATSIAITGGEAENCDGCAVATKPKPGDVIVWNGSVSVDWTESSNWDRKRLPIATDVVVIPGDCQNYPTVETDIVLNSFSNLVGGCINMSGANMTVTNAFANLGTLTTKDNDILYLSGDGLTEADFGLSSYTNVYVTKTAGGVNFVNGLNARYFRCVNDASIALSFGAGKLFKTEQLVLADAEANELTSPGLELKSIVPGEKWLLDTTENYIVKGLKISDCTFTGESDDAFKVGALAVDNGGNSKIDFAESAAAFWSNGALTAAESWMPALLPQASTHVMIAPYAGKTATFSANSQIQYGDLVVGGLGGSATVTLSKKYNLNGGLAINRLGTVKSDYFSSPNKIAGNIWITRGGVLSHSAHVQGDRNTEKYKVSIDVDGDITINEGAIIDVKGCGFYTGYGPGKSAKLHDGSSYASVGVNAWGTNGNGPPKRCYGSILSPFSLGSAGSYGTGGGAVRLNSKGVIRLYGTIDADGGHASHTPGTGGSIWLTAADLAGGGKITASMGASDDEDHRRSSGGRIALYKTSSEGWENFKWTVVCSGFDATGSYYRQDASGNGELYLNQAKMSSGSVGGTEFPMADDLVGSSARSAYRNVAVILGDRTTLCITNTKWQAGSTVCVRDINLVASGAKIDCLGSTIKITSQEHRNGAGWTGGDFQSRLDNGTITLRTGGAILWSMGFSIKIR